MKFLLAVLLMSLLGVSAYAQDDVEPVEPTATPLPSSSLRDVQVDACGFYDQDLGFKHGSSRRIRVLTAHGDLAVKLSERAASAEILVVGFNRAGEVTLSDVVPVYRDNENYHQAYDNTGPVTFNWRTQEGLDMRWEIPIDRGDPTTHVFLCLPLRVRYLDGGIKTDAAVLLLFRSSISSIAPASDGRGRTEYIGPTIEITPSP